MSVEELQRYYSVICRLCESWWLFSFSPLS